LRAWGGKIHLKVTMRYIGLFCLLTAVIGQAQTEAALKTFFEGKKVLLKLDLPAGKDGVDVNPKAQPMVDLKRYSTRLRQYGPALHKGDSATITLVSVKEKSIEFQLAGAGYGILSDDTSATPLSLVIPKNPQASPGHLLGTALIHLQYRDNSLKAGIPTAEELLPVLSEVVDFGGGQKVSTSRSDLSAPMKKATLKKGMTEGQVLRLFGAPRQSREHVEGNAKVVTNTFLSAGESIEVDFVKNVVVDYRIR
jgi:hypothetical protein